MKKYGKFEKKGRSAPVKQKQAESVKQPDVKKSVLLQTYFTSLFSLVLCTAMFFGTSYAWFSSEVVSESNEIYVGTLDVGLHMKNGNDAISLASSESNAKLFDRSFFWEPGYTALETIEITNNGNLDFKYVLSFTEGAAVTLAAEQKTEYEPIAECFSVYVFGPSGTAPSVNSFADIKNAPNWTAVGTLAEVLAGKPVLSGNLSSSDSNEEKSHTYTIALHMNESSTVEAAMGKKLSMNVKLVAYQNNTNSSFISDQIAYVSNAEELVAPWNNAVLISDIAVDENCEIGVNILLDGNGKSIKGNSVGVLASNGGEIRNLTFDCIVSPMGGVTFTDCTFADSLDMSKLMDGGTVTLTNCKYGGKTIEKAVVAKNAGVIAIDGTGALTLNSETKILQ